MFVRDEQRIDVGGCTFNTSEPLGQPLQRQPAVDHDQGVIVLDQQRVTATATGERAKAQTQRLLRNHLAFGAAFSTFATRRRIHRHRELSHVAAIGSRDLACTLLVDLVDAKYRVHRQIGLLHALELGLDLLFGRIDNDSRPGAEDQLFNLDETEQGAVADALCVNLVNLALIQKLDLVDGCCRHVESLAQALFGYVSVKHVTVSVARCWHDARHRYTHHIS